LIHFYKREGAGEEWSGEAAAAAADLSGEAAAAAADLWAALRYTV